MKIQYASDLHLEFADNYKFVNSIPFEVMGEVLVLAGDITYLNEDIVIDKFWQWASENFREVLIVPGNHEYYKNSDLANYGDSWIKEILPNVKYYQNKVVRIDNTDFILSTLWSRIKVLEEMEVRRGLSDFRQIMYNGERFLPVNYNAEHEKCLSFIKQSVAESTAERIVMVTHHLPTAAVVAPWHKNSTVGSAFATELSKFIEESNIDAWIYGHSHTNFDTQIGNTRIVSNQLGYLQLSEQRFGFSGEKFIEV